MTLLYGPPPATLAHLLGHTDFAAPEQILGQLAPAQAARRVADLPHSIGEIVGHLWANMAFNLDLIEGRRPGEREAWPTVQAADWPVLHTAFFDVLSQLTRLARDPAVLERVIFEATETEAGWTAGYKLAVNVAQHNAYHLGQIVTIRQLMGAWPPAT